MADKVKKVNENKKKKKVGTAEYVNARPFLRPGPAIALVFLMIFMTITAVSVVIAVNNTIAGNIIKGNSILGSGSSVIVKPPTNEVSDLSSLSVQLAALSPTDTEWTNIADDPSQNGFFCISKESRDDKLIVFNVDPANVCQQGYTLNDFNYIWVDSIDSSFYAVVNISGEVVDLSNYYILVHDDSGNLASRLIINCYEAKVVSLKNTILTGTLIAPNANIEYDATSVYGQVYAPSYTGVRAYYKDISFGGYALLNASARSVYFENAAIRSVVVSWLKANYKETYGSYSDSYNPCGNDLSLITDLDLSGLLIASFGNDLTYFTALETLNVKSTKLTYLDVSMLKNLKYLDISDTDIKTIKFAEDNCITTLIGKNSSLTTLDVDVLKQLEVLNVSGVKFKTTPKYAKIVTLKELNISNTGFEGFGSDAGAALNKLEKIVCTDNEKLVYMDLTVFPKLTYADLSNTSVENVYLKDTMKILYLGLSYTKLGVVDVSMLKTLMQLDVFGSYDNVIALGTTKVNSFPSQKVTVVNIEETDGGQ